jgi:Cys-tRNA(Pro)/Cys-tRNA(Cys) deacylase
VQYEAMSFSPQVHSAVGVAEALDVDTAMVYKTLVAVPLDGHPLLVLVPGEHDLDLKRTARAVGAKKVRMASHREAESLTGLKTGGISALALLGRSFVVVIDGRCRALDEIVVSAGARGINLRLAVDDLVRVTGALVADVAAPLPRERASTD